MYKQILLYILFNFIFFYFISKVSYFLNLIDVPDKRKIHLKPVAYTGGIAISLVLLFVVKIINFNDEILSVLISISFLISLVGLIDDKFKLNVGGKLSLQIIPIFYLIIFENLSLNTLGNYVYFSLDLGSFKISFTLLSVLFLVNAFNYFDGLDGTLSLTCISVLVILLFLLQNNNIQLYIVAILIPLVVFLFFNFSLFKLPKLFLGDSGSLFLGFITSFILIYAATQKIVHPILLAWSVVIFVYEFLSVNLIRLKNKKNLFLPDTDHLHHLILKKTNSLLFTNFAINLINIALFIIGYMTYIITNELISLFLFIILFFSYLVLRNLLYKNLKKNNYIFKKM